MTATSPDPRPTDPRSGQSRIADPRITGRPAAVSFDSLSPATGEVVGTHAIDDRESVDAAVLQARAAAAFWMALSFAERARRLTTWAAVLTRRIGQLAELVHAETGKPHSDCQLEIVLAIEHLAWAAKHAGRVLGPRRVWPGLLMANHTASVEYRPLGVVGVIGPWNYPVFTPIGSIAYALAAGNAVVFKPSEYTPGVGAWLVDTFAQIVPEAPVLQLVTGYGETGEALCHAGVDKIAFTGSTATGKKVMHACADGLVPVLIEAGGKDALLVDVDADIPAAADAAVWGGMANAGQTCAGVERVYVHEQVYDTFLAALTTRVSDLRAGPGERIGPITMPAQLAVIRRHITDALDRGATALVGGRDAVGDRYVQPTVLLDVPEDSCAVKEETFGPTLTIAKVADMDEAVRRTNASAYGLGAAVYSRTRGTELARRIDAGMVAVNSVISFAAIASLPFGGIKQSGFGRIHGPDGLREFAAPKAITRQRFTSPLHLTTFTRTARTDQTLATLTTLLHGRASTLPRRRHRPH
jgi:acyl-CoA reductase-like NAD-dependent aldehyde dehydrogenase